jgi:hypothetical protein
LRKTQFEEGYSVQLKKYASTKAKKESRDRLSELDEWYFQNNCFIKFRYHSDLRDLLRERGYAEKEELVRLTEWKMLRGQWRPRNLQVFGILSPHTFKSWSNPTTRKQSFQVPKKHLLS